MSFHVLAKHFVAASFTPQKGRHIFVWRGDFAVFPLMVWLDFLVLLPFASNKNLPTTILMEPISMLFVSRFAVWFFANGTNDLTSHAADNVLGKRP